MGHERLEAATGGVGEVRDLVSLEELGARAGTRRPLWSQSGETWCRAVLGDN